MRKSPGMQKATKETETKSGSSSQCSKLSSLPEGIGKISSRRKSDPCCILGKVIRQGKGHLRAHGTVSSKGTAPIGYSLETDCASQLWETKSTLDGLSFAGYMYSVVFESS